MADPAVFNRSTDDSRVVTLDDHRSTKNPKPEFSDSGGGGSSVDKETKRYVDAKMDSVKAQNDARFAEVLAKLDAINVPPIWQFAGIAFVTLGAAFAILAYASDRFDGGLAAGSLLEALSDKQAARDDLQDNKLDLILEQVSGANAKSETSPPSK